MYEAFMDMSGLLVTAALLAALVGICLLPVLGGQRGGPGGWADQSQHRPVIHLGPRPF
jgi:hypothetical protein